MFSHDVETIGEAWQVGWRVTARCAFGKRYGMKSIRECVYLRPGHVDVDLDRWKELPTGSPRLTPEMPALRIEQHLAPLPHAEGSGHRDRGRPLWAFFAFDETSP